MNEAHGSRWLGSTPGVADRVSTFELFFDLVFVFAVTQLTAVLYRHPDVVGVLRVALVLSVLWWMYGGYAWLTNAVPPTDLVGRLLVLVGMAGFLVIALSIPEAFGDSGIAFGVGYLVVTLVHSVLYLRAAEQRTVAAIVRLAPFNLLIALLILGAGFVTGPADWVLWSLAFAVECISPYFSRIAGFEIRPAHFVERHGLVVIIALGESLVSVAAGVADRPVTVGLVTVALLGLGVTAALWWVFFAEDDDRAERALTATSPARRPWLAVQAFGYAFIPVLGGIVMRAAGNKIAITHLAERASWAGATFQAGGVALYLVGDCWFRERLGLGPVRYRLTAAALVVPVVLLGRVLSSEIELAALLLVLVTMLVAESRFTVRREENTHGLES